MLNKKYIILLYFLLLLALSFYSYRVHARKIKTHIGDELLLKVVKVSYTDTIYLVNKDNKKLKIKLANIFFPKKDTIGWDESIRMIDDKLIGSKIKVKIIDKDKFNIFLALISLDDKDFNYYLVEQGCAWHDKRYARFHQSRIDYINYHEAEKLAKKQKKCLWSYKMYN